MIGFIFKLSELLIKETVAWPVLTSLADMPIKGIRRSSRNLFFIIKFYHYINFESCFMF